LPKQRTLKKLLNQINPDSTDGNIDVSKILRSLDCFGISDCLKSAEDLYSSTRHSTPIKKHKKSITTYSVRRSPRLTKNTTPAPLQVKQKPPIKAKPHKGPVASKRKGRPTAKELALIIEQLKDKKIIESEEEIKPSYVSYVTSKTKSTPKTDKSLTSKRRHAWKQVKADYEKQLKYALRYADSELLTKGYEETDSATISLGDTLLLTSMETIFNRMKGKERAQDELRLLSLKRASH